MYIVSVRSKATIDSAGRIILPKALREEFRLEPGDTLDVTCRDGEIRLAPVRPAALIRQERGVWVFQGGPAHMSVVDVVDRDRACRLRDTMP